MNNVCTPTTAARLKAAGFSQPAPAPGQFWYIDNELYFLRIIRGIQMCVLVGDSISGGALLDAHPDAVFAPGVADLLQILGHDYALIYEETTGDFAVYEADGMEIGRQVAQNTNPAEALAAPWLEAHES